ncbi:GMC family oxidoreductase [Leifsonia shinshuensis]|uniref:Choline oxidase n=1 Tax=Leifsonia shinshuensis TaxID=150026 RepID=A0A7G6Y8Z0_9MICO|nr:GMC oxidoreductase [Leifsonia shinshuensis]QNE34955.1 choline oxidase [Leifsonia shinshuensis]
MTLQPAAQPAAEYDYVVVGGGTAGGIVAARLSENPDVTVALLEWGPSDRDEGRARELRRWEEMIESEYDLDYRSVPQERGNSAIRQTRMRILGGCSTANTMIAWRPLASDLDEWVEAGAAGWDAASFQPYFDRLAIPVHPVGAADRNPFVADVVASAVTALGLPLQERWNDGRTDTLARGAGFFEVGYDPETNVRGSSSIHYLHDVMDVRDSLEVITGARATRIVVSDGRAVAVQYRDPSGALHEVRARREIVLACGAIDTPRLLLLSGIGPAAVVTAAGVEPVLDLPGVGENLQDHAEGLVVWEAVSAPPAVSASGWDAGAMVGVDGDPRKPDVLMHFPVEPVVDHPRARGVSFPSSIVAIAPNVAKPHSRGRVTIASADPDEPPVIDYRYFTDASGHDERMLVAGVRAARRIAEAEPMRSHLVREVFPGPDVQTDEELSAAQRAIHQTVYHVSGTCRMGAEDDDLAVVDPELRVRGIDGLRIADASVFPTLTSVNPVITVMMVAERAAELVAASVPA